MVVCACAAKTETAKIAVKKTAILIIGTLPVSDVRPKAMGRPVRLVQSSVNEAAVDHERPRELR
jgi:hypothetical protein